MFENIFAQQWQDEIFSDDHDQCAGDTPHIRVGHQ